ncbi:MAG: bifunctional adenosylcobinamide kinase/adenosylcobinamide-phosphate guanylyltransferase [Gloeobacterales cyanobacterium]
MVLILITGPSRSGKSAWAEALAQKTHQPITYIATAAHNPDDPEWEARIAQHQQRRPASWKLLELNRELISYLQEQQDPTSCLLIDSLGTWLTAWLEESEENWEPIATAFTEVITNYRGTVILVTEEVGWGVVPTYPMGRLFRDRLGTLNQRLGVTAKEVYLVVSGYALDLKKFGIPTQM